MRFELTVPCGTLVFKTSAIDHSATLPNDFDINKKVSFMLASIYEIPRH